MIQTYMPNHSNDPTKQQMSEFLKYIGLTGNDIGLLSEIESSRNDSTINFMVTFKISVPPTHSPTEVLDLYISSLRERIRNSEEVNRMVKDVHDKNAELNFTVHHLKDHLDQLMPLKNHYDVEMKLRHGETESKISLNGLPERGLK